ncbi:MauE/DoxX family redox-associated membrane protein [Streptomyces lycii]|uniref:Methylamine utilization protein MauE n=1 Tax=Streptomyces lycii TaxID=2654337 RepID=A0ABQ7FG65_9ACTN|nr:MauE/DoxX family redox-associated membrane protein [Streptomyces lycii]KAF4408031.1 methylamine utilization protein MauE [Streptomyces lycii]
MDYVLISCRALIGTVFLLSAVGKIRGRRRYTDFVTAVRGLAPGLPARGVAPAVIAAEAAVVVLLLRTESAAPGFVVALGLLAAFTAAIGAAVAKDRRVACQCFGASSAPVGAAHLVRNGVLLAAAASGLAAALGGTATGLRAEVVLTALATGVAVAVMTSFTDDIAHLFRPLD